ncbi:hypothetical protein F1880_000730 [Penicillium rolfsii]|nr:hypothetical protein F1880_000730 [Penicillium rolfsii]
MYVLRPRRLLTMNNIDENQSPPSNPRKRRRPALSCQQCRARKVKCDKEMPCGQCTKAYGSLKCSYVHEGKAALDAKIEMSRRIGYESPTSPVGSYVGAENGTGASVDGLSDAARIAHLESRVRALHDRLSSLEGQIQGQAEDNRPASGNSGLNKDLNGLGERIAELERLSSSSRSERTVPSQTTIPPLAPRLKNVGERTRLFGTTHWALTFPQLRLLRQVRSTASYTDSNQNEMSKLLREVRGLRRIIKSRQTPQLLDPAPDLLNDLPSREVCDELVRHYFRTLGLVYQVMHMPSFYQEYERFWEKPHSASTGWVRLMSLVYRFDGGSMPRSGGFLDHLKENAYAMDKESNWAAAGTLLRQAIQQGLHRDPSNFPAISAFDAEMRRRIWASILEINIQFSLDAAMPPLLTPEDYDTRQPANLGDDEFDRSTNDMPPSQPKHYYTTSSLQILLCRSFHVRLRIARTINDCSHEQSYENTLHLGRELTAACKEMAALFHAWFSRTSKSMFPPTQFHQRVMDTILRRFMLNLYRPFASRATQDPRFYLSRKLSVDSALILASYAESPLLDLNSNPSPCRDFQRLSLSGTGIFKGCLSLDVIMVLSLELITQLEDEATMLATVPAPPLSNATDQIIQNACTPLIQALERIRDHLYQGIAAGIPSMKRYCLLTGVLAQVQAVPQGEQAEWTHIREAFMDSMRTCRELLQQHTSNGLPAQVTGETLFTPSDGVYGFTPESAIGSSIDSEFMVSDLGFDDLSFWDIPNFLDTEMLAASQNEQGSI